ncbi:LAME_0H14840g1_1 [Lachancea meyersii CBS 8951]|uniref:LAME_0H14840g1_1 n=1 Tax=Lachancea meyersii CBS 8951 TaxID=1266667 RepID=A0A1G4KHE7_9SACH|nr:LAME_0H14840g1_1 [Lachancea meyersii CBS 8951]
MSILGPLVKVADAINALNAKYTALTFQEQKALTVMERVRFYNWTFEFWALGLLALIYVFHVIGTKLNKNRADNIFAALTQCFDELAFAKVGFSTRTSKNQPFVAEKNNTWFTSFATGRSCVESITVRARLLARFNPLSIVMEKALGMFFPSLVASDMDEFVDITIKANGVYVASTTADLPKSPNDAAAVLSKFKFIASIVNKSDMTKARENNYYLSLTHTSESEKLPLEYVYMSENKQLNSVFDHYGGATLKPLLSESARFLSFLAFTDLPETKPISDKLWERYQQPRCVIRTKVVTSAADTACLNKLVKAAVAIVDAATQDYVQNPVKAFVTNDMLKRSANLRSQELAKIVKVMKQAERELLQEKKQELEREKRRESRNKLSGEEQDKAEQKMRERRERRQRNKQKMRM